MPMQDYKYSTAQNPLQDGQTIADMIKLLPDKFAPFLAQNGFNSEIVFVTQDDGESGADFTLTETTTKKIFPGVIAKVPDLEAYVITVAIPYPGLGEDRGLQKAFTMLLITL